jgi:2-polyprenyl-3-methyl-5-hydroxy-6-metoxy-1,4-benzoquinol methylase
VPLSDSQPTALLDLTIIIPTKNDVQRLRECLAAIGAGWASEIVVVDSHSTDDTAIAVAVSQLQDAFDVIVSVEVIEHLLLPRQLFSRAKEALKRNGELIITTPYHGYWKNLLIALTGKFDDHWHPLRDYGHVKFFSTQTLSKLFEEQGFELTHVKRVGRIPPVAKSLMMRGRLRS